MIPWLSGRGAAAVAAAAVAGGALLSVLVATGWWLLLTFAAAPWPLQATTVVIPEGSGVAAIADQLYRARVLAHPTAFRMLAKIRGVERMLHAGEYAFAAHETAAQIMARLASGGLAPYAKVTVPEGFTAIQIAQRMAAAGLGAERTYQRIFLHTPLVIDGQRTVDMEGFLFPDTYEFDRGATPMENAMRMVAQFERELPADAVQRARRLGMTIPQVVTIASLVEREAKVDDERALIAGIYYHRLRIGMPLQVDATIEYALPSHATVITRHDLEIDSPYNTYLRAGLPPTPIANPGAASLRAAFDPQTSPYLYYVYRGDGRHAFATTLAEQQANIARYLK